MRYVTGGPVLPGSFVAAAWYGCDGAFSTDEWNTTPKNRREENLVVAI